MIAYTEARLLYLEVFSSGGKGDAMPKATIIALRDHLQEIRTKVDQEQVMQSSRAAQDSSAGAKLGTAGAIESALRQKQEMGEQASASSLAEDVETLKGGMAEILSLLKASKLGHDK